MWLITWPFKLIGFIFSMVGRLFSLILGLVVIVFGALLTATVVGAIVGIPLILLGAGMLLSAIFRRC